MASKISKLIARKKRLVTAAQREAGRKNISEFNRQRNGTPALVHGATSVAAQRGELPAAFQHLQPVVDEYWSGWVSDAGGEENLTKAKKAILFTARACLVVILLALERLQQVGLVDQRGRVEPVADILATYVNSLRLALTTCGLERGARNITPRTLEQYLASRTTTSTAPASGEGK